MDLAAQSYGKGWQICRVTTPPGPSLISNQTNPAYRLAATGGVAFSSASTAHKNMKTLLTLIAIAFLGTISVDAKTFKLPNDDFAIASIDMPDSWKPKAFDNGVSGQSADDAVYISVAAVGSEKGMQAEIEDTF